MEQRQLNIHQEHVRCARELPHKPARLRRGHGLEAEGLGLRVEDSPAVVDPAAHLEVLGRMVVWVHFPLAPLGGLE
eukprot:15431181-Alexandrium_andersonii.AAC.1